jgi:hypothetical protein
MLAKLFALVPQALALAQSASGSHPANLIAIASTVAAVIHAYQGGDWVQVVQLIVSGLTAAGVLHAVDIPAPPKS